MKEHPAPWKFAWPRATAKVFDADGRTVVVVSSGTIQGAYDTDDIFATGEAIAALPELLEACREAEVALRDLANFYVNAPDHNPSFAAGVELTRRTVRAAIAKAEEKS
jgi:hypothetical protein